MPSDDYPTDVFINSPIDDEYEPLFRSIVFAVFDCGFRPRCSREVADSSEVRIETISRIISECRFGIHDLSRTEPDGRTGLPRFNMPLELGLFLGAKRFGDSRQKRKNCLILDRQRYRFQKFISDISGQDIESHGGRPKNAIGVVRDWPSTASKRQGVPGGAVIHKRFLRFGRQLPRICEKLQQQPSALTYNEYANVVEIWLRENA